MDGIEAVYGVGNLTSRSKRSNGTGTRRPTSPMSLRFDPFVYEDADNHGGGAWLQISPPPDCECDGIQEIPTSPTPGSPSAVKNIMLNAKDKEALLEEIMRLKRALHEQDLYLRRDKVYALALQAENRKLEFDIKDLEMQGSTLDSIKSSRGRSIRTRLKGLKIRYDDMRDACDAQHEEIAILRRDVRVTTTQEMEMERDALFQEILRMQKDVKGLRTIQNVLRCEQQELYSIRDKSDELENLNHKLENTMDVVNKDLEKTNQDMVIFRQKMIESSMEARKNARNFKELQEHTAALKILIEEERSERLGLDKQLVCLEEQLKKAEQELAAKGFKPGTPAKQKPKPRQKIWEVSPPKKEVTTSPRTPRSKPKGKLTKVKDTPAAVGPPTGGAGFQSSLKSLTWRFTQEPGAVAAKMEIPASPSKTIEISAAASKTEKPELESRPITSDAFKKQQTSNFRAGTAPDQTSAVGRPVLKPQGKQEGTSKQPGKQQPESKERISKQKQDEAAKRQTVRVRDDKKQALKIADEASKGGESITEDDRAEISKTVGSGQDARDGKVQEEGDEEGQEARYKDGSSSKETSERDGKDRTGSPSTAEERIQNKGDEVKLVSTNGKNTANELQHRLKVERTEKASQTMETLESYDELMKKVRKLEDELASREASPRVVSPPITRTATVTPKRPLTTSKSIAKPAPIPEDKKVDLKLAKKPTVKRSGTIAKPKVEPSKPEVEPPKPKVEPPKPKVEPPKPKEQPMQSARSSATDGRRRPMRRQILMADRDYAEDTKQIVGMDPPPARPTSVIFDSLSFNSLSSDPAHPLVETSPQDQITKKG